MLFIEVGEVWWVVVLKEEFDVNLVCAGYGKVDLRPLEVELNRNNTLDSVNEVDDDPVGMFELIVVQPGRCKAPLVGSCPDAGNGLAAVVPPFLMVVPLPPRLSFSPHIFSTTVEGIGTSIATLSFLSPITRTTSSPMKFTVRSVTGNVGLVCVSNSSSPSGTTNLSEEGYPNATLFRRFLIQPRTLRKGSLELLCALFGIRAVKGTCKGMVRKIVVWVGLAHDVVSLEMAGDVVLVLLLWTLFVVVVENCGGDGRGVTLDETESCCNFSILEP